MANTPFIHCIPSNYKIAPKKRKPRPKSGQNTLHRGHGLSYQDRKNGLGKIIPSEVPCKKISPFVTKPSILISSKSITYTTTTFTTNSVTNPLPLLPTISLHTLYPSARTKWTRPMGCSLKGGGPPKTVSINLVGSKPYIPQKDSMKLTITCADSVVECSLSLLQQECGTCR